jgi:hypothetical protein
LPPESIQQEDRNHAGGDGQGSECRGRIGKHDRDQPAQRHVENVAGGVGLVPDHVELVEGQRELHRVPRGKKARSIGPAAGERQAPDGQRQDPVLSRHRDSRA